MPDAAPPTSSTHRTAPPVPADDAELRGLLLDRFGFDEFRPGQRRVVGDLLEGGSALAVFPTGGGKSLCYQLPALVLDGVTVVVSPLIALMKDQIDALAERGIAAARLDSSLTADEARAVSAGVRDGTLRILYVAPERFNNERFLRLLERSRIALFAVDEAHCISEWGHNFRPDYLKLARTAVEVGAERVLALTATATPAVVRDVCAGFGIPPERATVTGFHRPNLFLASSPALLAERDGRLVERMRSRPPGSGIVYVTLQRTAERVAAVLADAGFPARAYHAGMKDEARTEVQEWWKAAERATVVATIAFGMGIDKADVRYVYHYDLPKSLEGYAQEIGRAGRDGAPSTVEVLGGPEDVAALENFAFGDTPTEDAVRGVVEELLSGPRDFDVALYDLSRRHDVRTLVLRTLLTYLELDGVLRQGTPFYAGYRVRFAGGGPDEVAARFSGERSRFVAGIFREAKQGRVWWSLDPETVAAALGEDRGRVVRAVEYVGEQGWATVQASDLRHRFHRLRDDVDAEALVADLLARFERREGQEVARVAQVVDLVSGDACITRRLLSYFGEEMPEPCGHCTVCETGRGAGFPALPPAPPIDARVDTASIDDLRRAHPDALGDARQAARFLCGISSPALTREKLSRHPAFGALEGRRFEEVRAWVDATAGRDE